MKNILFFAERLLVSYSIGFIAILVSVLLSAQHLSAALSNSTTTTDILWFVLALFFIIAVFVMYLDGRPVFKDILYYSKISMLNYVFSLYIVVHPILFSEFDFFFLLLPAMLLSVFNIFLLSRIQYGLYEYIMIPEIQKLHKMLPELHAINIDFDYTFLRKKPDDEKKRFKIMTTMGELLFDGRHLYLNGDKYEVESFVVGFKACSIDINSSTPEDAMVMQMYCL